MSLLPLRIRRATTDDFRGLQALWQSMQFPSAELEKRLTDFQVVEAADGQLAGAIGLLITDRHALLHSEGYTDFSVADAARELFWERIQTIAAHHGVLRLWTQEKSPFWVRWGFQPATPEILEHLPATWKGSEDPWLTFQLKDEAAMAAAEKELAIFRESEKKRMVETLDQARTMTTTVTVIAFIMAAILIGFAFFFLMRRFLPQPTQGRQGELIRMVGASHHRPAGHMHKPQRPGPPAVCCELIR
jgi:N-acetylglutamate synthase-like GNAT family acetyltransferase